jgi:hypothetical protein
VRVPSSVARRECLEVLAGAGTGDRFGKTLSFDAMCDRFTRIRTVARLTACEYERPLRGSKLSGTLTGSGLWSFCRGRFSNVGVMQLIFNNHQFCI